MKTMLRTVGKPKFTDGEIMLYSPVSSSRPKCTKSRYSEMHGAKNVVWGSSELLPLTNGTCDWFPAKIIAAQQALVYQGALSIEETW